MDLANDFFLRQLIINIIYECVLQFLFLDQIPNDVIISNQK